MESSTSSISLALPAADSASGAGRPASWARGRASGALVSASGADGSSLVEVFGSSLAEVLGSSLGEDSEAAGAAGSTGLVVGSALEAVVPALSEGGI